MPLGVHRISLNLILFVHLKNDKLSFTLNKIEENFHMDVSTWKQIAKLNIPPTTEDVILKNGTKKMVIDNYEWSRLYKLSKLKINDMLCCNLK